MGLVVPAVLPKSKRELEEGLDLVTHIPSVSRVQIDVVDGRFATPASWSYTAPAELAAMAARAEMLPRLDRVEYEMDLMCLDPEREAASWLALGATRLTFHAESIPDLRRFLTSIQKRYGSVVTIGLALNIATNPALIEPYLNDIGYVQFMGIARIGQQGQPFDERAVERVRAFHTTHPALPVQVDGGVSLQSAPRLIAAGASNLIVGSALLRARDPLAVAAAFEELQSPFGV